MKKIRRFFRLSSLTYKSIFGIMDFKTYFFTKLISPVITMLFFCYLTLHAYGKDNLAYWVIGNAFATCVFPVFLGAAMTLAIDRRGGTLRAVIATPTSRIVIFMSRSVMHIIDAIIIALIANVVGAIMFKLDYNNVNIPLFALAILVSMFGAVALGTMVSSIGLVFRDMNIIVNIGILGLIILTGANVAVSSLPTVLRVISNCLPLTRGIEAARLLYAKGSLEQIYRLIMEEFILGLVYLGIGFFMFLIFEKVARKYATLDFY